jgi:alpha-1,2-mannosyltransferase
MVVSTDFAFIRWINHLLDRRHLVRYWGALLAIELLASLFFVDGTYGLIVPLPKPATTDFVSFYAAGALANTGTPQLVYDAVQHHAAEEKATEAGVGHNFFYYPPIFILVCAALARLPYLAAFLLFEITTLAAYLVVARAILNETDWATLLPVIAFPAVFWNFGFGQNAFLTAALFGAGTLYLDRRPLVAGLLFGALCYKPQFGVLIPVALAAGGHWRAFAVAFASACALSLLSLAAFGWETWHDFITALSASSAAYATGRIPFSGYINPFGAVRQLGGSPALGYTMQAAAIVAAGTFVAYVWRRDFPLPIRAASLVSATLVAAPLAMFYDLVLAEVAALWLLRNNGDNRLAEWEKVALAGLFVLSLTPRTMAEFSHLPIGPFIATALAVLVSLRVFRYGLAGRMRLEVA